LLLLVLSLVGFKRPLVDCTPVVRHENKGGTCPRLRQLHNSSAVGDANHCFRIVFSMPACR
jgi:hypothetical protein